MFIRILERYIIPGVKEGDVQIELGGILFSYTPRVQLFLRVQRFSSVGRTEVGRIVEPSIGEIFLFFRNETTSGTTV